MSNQLYNEISDKIEQRIINSSINEGDKLPSERVLAEEYGVSRNVVREAIRQLCEKDLVEIKPGKGAYVKTPSEEKVLEVLKRVLVNNRSTLYEILEVREQIELAIIKKAAERIQENSIAYLKELYDEMEKNKKNISKYVDLDFEFHIGLAKSTNNTMFLVLVNTFYKIADKILFSTTKLRPQDIKIAQEHHKMIINALMLHDKDEASAMMQKHMDFIREEITELAEHGHKHSTSK